MRSIEEVERMDEWLSTVAESLDWKGDNFKYGMYLGKVMAISWVLQQEKSGEMQIHYDFEDWQLEMKSVADEFRGKIDGPDNGTDRDDSE